MAPFALRNGFLFASSLVLVGAVTREKESLFRSISTVDRLVTCAVAPGQAIFQGEGLWQSGNTLESMSNVMLASNITSWTDFLQRAYDTTPVIIDQCFDDHQWWLLAWVRAYQLTKNIQFITRASQVFDYVINSGWSTDVCGGGVMWCPVSAANQYKNAITNELFLASAMALHPFASVVGKPADFYLKWALTEWGWFEQSGMFNSGGLINDGLDQNCKNNGGITWTYNQGVLLSGLTQLGLATNNATMIKIAKNLALSTQNQLTVNGILVEPCGGNCDGDQQLFKGIFMRHLGYLVSEIPQDNTTAQLQQFLIVNAQSVLSHSSCPGGGYGLHWDGPCISPTVLGVVPQTSSALDVLTAAASVLSDSKLEEVSLKSAWSGLGIGNCVDDSNNSMPNCFSGDKAVDEVACRDRAFSDPRAVAYDFQINCDGSSFCRVRTLSGPNSCGSGWQWGNGSATAVTNSNGVSLTVCVVKTS